ncbi:biopolymer transporter ExbD [Pigmentiphaga litoralis]|jgi:biopolymer transport protein ExbD|uniref:ExbD/TolR family protein n=1 Tax=Pigmentiphaga litoralis TaxID=516702 RepID=UPI0016740223|nr:biopolymer transporter ExbD [Pigmentiphaga litoralis]GGX35633.1 biopolymer transporter ExbD [Pigmentiphaga litoralis]
MNFRRRRHIEDPEINLIPLIDVLLVIMIFLAASTSFSKFSQLSITLPTASNETRAAPPQVTVTVAADGRYALNGRALQYRDAETLSQALRAAVQGRTEPSLVIDADAGATHQSVVNAMEAARLAGIARVGFTTRTNAGAKR